MKVSVIIPTYNRPGYLAQAVHSVLQQTHPVFEIIIVDDRSSIIHRSKIEDLKQLDDRISVLHFPENKGVSVARNYGFEKSEGDFIIFLDDDDLLHPHMVESNLRVFAANREAGVVINVSNSVFDYRYWLQRIWEKVPNKIFYSYMTRTIEICPRLTPHRKKKLQQYFYGKHFDAVHVFRLNAYPVLGGIMTETFIFRVQTKKRGARKRGL